MARLPRIIAHRGLWMTAPGNSLEALRRAAELGADGVEIDVRRSADSLPILFHDRCTTDDRSVASLTRDELSAAVGHPVATLQEALESCDLPFWNVEMKTWEAWPEVLDTLQRFSEEREFLVTSFRHDELERRASGDASGSKGIRFGALIAHRPLNTSSLLRDLEELSCRVLVCEIGAVSEAFVGSLRTSGVDCFVYNVNTREDRDLCARCGIEGVITDFPQLFLQTRL